MKSKSKDLFDYKVICDRTGFTVMRSQCAKEWNGSLVRKESWERRHPADYIQPLRDKLAVLDPRPEGTDKFLSVNEVTTDDL